MKKWQRVLLSIVGAILAWILVVLAVFMNLNRIVARLYETKYDVTGYAQNGVLLIGSSTVQNWRSSESDLGPLRSVNLGLSGSAVADWPPLVDRLVTPFHPKAVVVYVGANDLHNSHTDPAIVADELQNLFSKIHEGLPEARVYYVTVYSVGAFPESRADEQALAAAVFGMAEKSDYLSVIDCAAALLGPDGEVRPELFNSDQVHLNEKGYAVWTKTIRDALMGDLGAGEE